MSEALDYFTLFVIVVCLCSAAWGLIMTITRLAPIFLIATFAGAMGALINFAILAAKHPEYFQ